MVLASSGVCVQQGLQTRVVPLSSKAAPASPVSMEPPARDMLGGTGAIVQQVYEYYKLKCRTEYMAEIVDERVEMLLYFDTYS